MDSLGANPTQLTNNRTDARGLAWSPDGTQIAWQSINPDNAAFSGIWAMNSNGGNQRLLAPGGASPTWSPDGLEIAFTREYPAEGFRGEIWVMNPDGSGKRMIAAGGGVDWSPDGERFAYVSSADGGAEIHVMNVDGSGNVQLTDNGVEEYWPHWSPDGSEIAFQYLIQFFPYRTVILAKQAAALRMTKDHKSTPRILQHLRRHLAGISSLLLPVTVLRPQLDVTLVKDFRSSHQVWKRWTYTYLNTFEWR